MNTDYELGLRASYLLNAARAWKQNPSWMLALADVAETCSGEFGLKYEFPYTQKPASTAGGKETKATRARSTKLTKANIEQLENYLGRVVKRFEKKPPDDGYTFLNKFFAHLEFESLDRRIAELLLLSSNGGFQNFFEHASTTKIQPTTLEIVSAFLGEDKKTVQPHLKFAGPLLSSGMVYEMTRDYDGMPVDESLTYFLHPKILASIDNGEFDVAAAVEELLGKPTPPETQWDDFAHIKAEAEFAARIIQGALREGAKGVNLLIYGDTGVGKTEFSRTLAAHLGVPLYPVGEKTEIVDDSFAENRRPDPSSPAARLADKRLVESMLGRRQTKALTMFDEMEDLLGSTQMRIPRGQISAFQMSKSATNNLLTQNDTPCLWTTNNIGRFDPSLLRRFSFAIGLGTPNADVRQRVILRTLHRYGRELTASQVRALAERHAVPPAFFSQAIRSAALADDGKTGDFHANLQLGMRSIGKLVTGQPETKIPRPVENYDLSLVNADQNLGELTAKIIAGGHRNFSICAYGVSGAGKSEYFLHLADKMGLEATVVPYSEIVSKWVGETEQNIRAKFEEAAEARKFLIFDEADSLLTDRRNAKNSWERTQVNEMLVQMQNHPFPFGCTTNLMDDIDQAALRRFSFKIRFKGLTEVQYQKAFRIYFGHDLPPGITLPSAIAPGDFDNVMRQAKILETTKDTAWLVKALCQECEIKDKANKPSNPIGFLAHLRP